MSPIQREKTKNIRYVYIVSEYQHKYKIPSSLQKSREGHPKVLTFASYKT
ncbi:MAG: hypothetical protein LBF22_13690 [Deltaproteobacteria bacterium]|jgi:hypothetical protein|nr:hypothetical protein [Deltaproteobacteria bacterium]